MKCFTWAYLGLLVFFLSCPLQASSPQKDSVSVYIQQSMKGTLQKNSDAEYILTLKGNSLNLVYFTDQPHRTTGQKSLSNYFETWNKNKKFKKNPPTAFINFNAFETSETDGVSPDILMLEDPDYNEESDTLVFKVQPLHDQPIKTGKLEHVVIIYDPDE